MRTCSVIGSQSTHYNIIFTINDTPKSFQLLYIFLGQATAGRIDNLFNRIFTRVYTYILYWVYENE